MSITIKNPAEMIQNFKPDIKQSSVNQYVRTLIKIKKMFEPKETIKTTEPNTNYDFLLEPEKVFLKIKDLNYLVQRNILNSIIVILLALDDYDTELKKYQDERDQLNQRYTDENATGEMISEKQNDNFATADELKSMIDKMKQSLEKQTNNKKKHQLQQAILLFSIYIKMPMRNDVSLMESIRQSDFKKIEDTKTKNYLVVSQKTMKFILNDYKTNKKYHQLTIPIEDKDLRLQLKRWIKQEGYGILFKTSTNKGMSRNELSKFLIKYSNQFIGKSVSTTLLRKSYLTNKYLPMKEEMEKDSNILAHDVSTTGLNVYVKKTK